MPFVRAGRRYRFSASHRLHTPLLNDERNREVYGKCNNPYGHGHNFILEVVIAGEVRTPGGRLLPLRLLDAFITELVLRHFDHVDLNTQVEEFAAAPPTSENLARVIARRLAAAWPVWFAGLEARLEMVRIWETPRNIFQEEVGVPEAQSGFQTAARAEAKS
jgi:6-pyruvoyltetrahydropterin/6-carboxytetrahydropterin synthase